MNPMPTWFYQGTEILQNHARVPQPVMFRTCAVFAIFTWKLFRIFECTRRVFVTMYAMEIFSKLSTFDNDEHSVKLQMIKH